MEKLERCRHCRAMIPGGSAEAVHGDHNRMYCTEACARRQLDGEQGSGARVLRAPGADGAPRGDRAGDRVARDGLPAVPRDGPTTR